jgi:starch synthase (maltosyl-transferring)
MPSAKETPITSGTAHTEHGGRRRPGRVVIERVNPEALCGRFAIKRAVGEPVDVTATMFAEGHDVLAGVVRFRPATGAGDAGPGVWQEVPLVSLGNDQWSASFTPTELGVYEFTVEGWPDEFASWRKELLAKAGAGQDVANELLEGAALVEAALARRGGREPLLTQAAVTLKQRGALDRQLALISEERLQRLMQSLPDRGNASTYEKTLRVLVDPVRARFSTWYEMFPRSCTSDPSRSGTFREAEARLPELADMGFDVLYLPPVHPIGRTFRKGPNNTLVAGPNDPGSPWAIGGPEGGHTAIEPGLGTIDDFDRFVQVANRLGIEIALDIAFQASPDHPWVTTHPQWFKHRPDGSIKYAENPPKKYQDIYPFDFESQDWRALWAALRDVFLFWIEHGVRTFRVDNPHTKPFAFWEWCLAEITRAHPDVIFLAEAFTRPAPMRRLAALGFNQSYTYFTWRNTASELREYLTELTTSEVREYMRPNFFANTPDILHEYLQHGGRPAFEVRLILAATLSASYGIYSGFELCENVAVRPGSEEYLDSEKYQIRIRDWSSPRNLKQLIATVNAIRRSQPALQYTTGLQFHDCDNASLLWYSKQAAGGPPVFVVVNTDPHWMQHGWVEVPLERLSLEPDATYVMDDLLDSTRYTWRGRRGYVRLDPAERVAHIFLVRKGTA